jgi:hypothetical protein
MQSFNDKYNDAVYLAGLRENDPEAFETDSYLIKGSLLKDEISCSFGKECLMGEKVGKGEIGDMKREDGEIYHVPLNYSWVFCFGCNNIAHLHCMGYSTKAFKEMSISEPFRCRVCTVNPNNDPAKEYFNDSYGSEFKISLRRELFMKSIDLSETADDAVGHDSTEMVDQITQKYEKKMHALSLRCATAESKLEQFEELKRAFEAFKLQMRDNTIRSSSVERDGHNTPSINHLLNTSRRTRLESEPKPLNINGRATNPDIGISNANPHDINKRRQGVGIEVPVPKPRTSFIDTIDVDDLSRAERINLEQAQAQREATEAQREIALTHNLASMRKALPKITKFNGDARKWIHFKRDVERYVNVGKYDEYEMRIYVLQALEGVARTRVEGSIDNVPFKTTMNILRKCFGEPTRIINQYAEDLLNIKVPKELTKDEVLMITSKMLDYFGACIYAEVDVLNSNQLAMHIFNQLSILHKQMYRHKNREASSKVIELDSLFTFLEELSDELEEKRIDKNKFDEKKSKPASVNTHYVAKSSGSSYTKSRLPDDFMFEIRDLSVNPLGYELKELAKLNKY